MSKDDYEVGYGKPPKHSQFKPGQSGNSKGRPKGTKNLATDLSEELAQKISINEGGKQQQISKQRALVKSLLSKALKGDIKAVNLLIQMVQQIENVSSQIVKSDEIDSDDRAVFQQFVAQFSSQKSIK